jgi:hypothetical protein
MSAQLEEAVPHANRRHAQQPWLLLPGRAFPAVPSAAGALVMIGEERFLKVMPFEADEPPGRAGHGPSRAPIYSVQDQDRRRPRRIGPRRAANPIQRAQFEHDVENGPITATRSPLDGRQLSSAIVYSRTLPTDSITVPLNVLFASAAVRVGARPPEGRFNLKVEQRVKGAVLRGIL